jgi:hypothetical protein
LRGDAETKAFATASGNDVGSGGASVCIHPDATIESIMALSDFVDGMIAEKSRSV